MFREFAEFLREYKIIGLAMAVLIGTKVNEFVATLVKDLLTPLLFQPLLRIARVENIRDLNVNGVFYGNVVAALMEFFIVALVIFLFAKKILREDKVEKK